MSLTGCCIIHILKDTSKEDKSNQHLEMVFYKEKFGPLRIRHHFGSRFYYIVSQAKSSFCFLCLSNSITAQGSCRRLLPQQQAQNQMKALPPVRNTIMMECTLCCFTDFPLDPSSLPGQDGLILQTITSLKYTCLLKRSLQALSWFQYPTNSQNKGFTMHFLSTTYFIIQM